MCKIVTVLSIIGQVQVSGHQKLFACVDGVFTYVPANFYVSRPYDLLTTRGFWITGNNEKRARPHGLFRKGIAQNCSSGHYACPVYNFTYLCHWSSHVQLFLCSTKPLFTQVPLLLASASCLIANNIALVYILVISRPTLASLVATPKLAYNLVGTLFYPIIPLLLWAFWGQIALSPPTTKSSM